MRRIPFCLLIGFLVIVLGPASVQSQFPSRSKGSGSTPGAGGSTPPSGTAPAAPSGGSSFGGSRGMFGDPSKLFDMMSGGKDVVSRDSLPNPLFAGMFDRFAQQMGVTNGQITREQFNQYMEQKAAGGSGQAAPTGQPAPGGPPSFSGKGGERGGGDQAEMMDRWADSMFRRYDSNGDGLLNYDEMPENLRIERDKFDENKDGFVDLTEYKKFFQASVAQRMAEGRDFAPPTARPADPDDHDEDDPPKPVVYRAGKLPKEMPSWFKTCDSDGDGQITLLEWRTAGRSLDEFQAVDRNGDGFVTIAEVMYTVQGKNNYNGVAVATSSTTAPPAAKGGSEGRGGRGESSGGLGGLFSRMGGGGTKGGEAPSADSKGGFSRSDKGAGDSGKGPPTGKSFGKSR